MNDLISIVKMGTVKAARDQKLGGRKGGKHGGVRGVPPTVLTREQFDDIKQRKPAALKKGQKGKGVMQYHTEEAAKFNRSRSWLEREIIRINKLGKMGVWGD